MVTGSKELMRDINEKLVLERIINSGQTSRATISKELGLTKATVSAIVVSLMEKGLVCEVGSAQTTTGRKPILLEFCRDAGYFVSIDLGNENITVIRTDLTGGNIKLETCRTPKKVEEIVETIERLIDGQIAAMSGTESLYGLSGIAIAIHGAVKDNKVVFAPYYDIASVDLEKILADKYGVAVNIDNEANLSALYEGTFGEEYSIVANISVHTGIGLGILVDHKLYTGANGNAGEIGHTIVEVGGRACPCGNRGCLEQYASERVLFKEFAEEKGIDIKDFEPDMFFEMYAKGDEVALATAERFVKYLSVGVNNVLNTYNPDEVIINSMFTANIPNIIEKLEKKLSSRVNHYKKIVPSSLQDMSILLGGVCMALKTFTGITQLRLGDVDSSL